MLTDFKAHANWNPLNVWADGEALPGARVGLGRRVARTNRRGRVVLRYRPRGRPGKRHARVAVRGLRSVRPVVRVLRP